jgi:hypothetical protein
MGPRPKESLPPKKPPELMEPFQSQNQTNDGATHSKPSLYQSSKMEQEIQSYSPAKVNTTTSASNLKQVIEGKSVYFNTTRVHSHRDHYKQVSGNKAPAVKTRVSPPNNKAHQHSLQPTLQTYRALPLSGTKLPPRPEHKPLPRPTKNKCSQEDHDMIRHISELLHTVSEMQPPQFEFDPTSEAADHNFKLLQSNNFHLEQLLNNPRNSVTAYGSEFKETDQIKKLLGHHHRWNDLETRLTQGAQFPLTELPDEIRHQDLVAALLRGNHKSAGKNTEFLALALKAEIKKGWALILKADDAETVPNLSLAPLGVAEHIGISATGQFVMKHRVTHDLSFKGAVSQASVNSRVDESKLEPCMFGHTLIRVIHRIVHSRLRHPTKIIWLRKEDFKSAYRRLHIKADTALSSAVSIEFNGEKYILIPLRLPFGGSPCPSDFCVVSDIITDTINDLMSNPAWDPQEVASNYVTKIPRAKPLPPDIPFATGRKLSVPLPDDDHASADCFIDDIITSAVDINDNLQRITAAPCTVIHALAHSAAGDTHISRQNMIADDKNEAEGGPEESKICLGWILDTRRLLIILPDHKFLAWSEQTRQIMHQKSANNDQLSSLLGRLEHVAIIMPMFAHFLNNIRSLQITAGKAKHNVRINNRVREDLKLSLQFLAVARSGISMNLVTFRTPDMTYINDASEHGLGGFATHGRAW